MQGKVVLPRFLSDTSDDAMRVQTDLARKATVQRRVQAALSLSRTVVALSRRAIARANPELDERGVALKFVELHYGRDLARAVAGSLARRARGEQ